MVIAITHIFNDNRQEGFYIQPFFWGIPLKNRDLQQKTAFIPARNNDQKVDIDTNADD